MKVSLRTFKLSGKYSHGVNKSTFLIYLEQLIQIVIYLTLILEIIITKYISEFVMFESK